MQDVPHERDEVAHQVEPNEGQIISKWIYPVEQTELESQLLARTQCQPKSYETNVMSCLDGWLGR